MSLKGTGSGALPPLLEQYVLLRDQYAEYILLFQVGDFYEAFGEDAERLSKLLNITLTHKQSKDFSTPMAGIPIRAAETHIERLLKLGQRIAVAEQVEDPSQAKGLVARAVTQLITPGTVALEEILRGEENFLASVAGGDGYALALLDVSTGEFKCAQVSSRGALYDELSRYRPAEVLLAPELEQNSTFMQEFNSRFSVMRSSASFEAPEQALQAQFGAIPTLLETAALRRACGAVLEYASRVLERLPAVRRIQRYDPGAQMRLDEAALRALEVFVPLSPTAPESATLFGALNDTRTAPGRRRLKAWLRAPLLDAGLIFDRLEAVEALYRDSETRKAIRAALYRAADLERLATRVAMQRANARDLVALLRTLELIPELQTLLEPFCERLLRDLQTRFDPIAHAAQMVQAALIETPPLRLTEGGFIRDGFDAELDQYRTRALEGRLWIARLEASERARTGIGNLKVGYNNVFGYYLEVTNTHKNLVPDDYRAVATLKDRMRFTRPDLREKEREVLHFEERARAREYTVFLELRTQLANHTERLQLLSSALADLDVLANLAEIAAIRNYVRPQMIERGEICLLEARHAVVETTNPNFVPNDFVATDKSRISLITGPNMSGKSTFLRQTALVALLAQIGSFVPARRASLRIFDRIFTRIGASDDLAGGASTFMVEMRELAQILHGVSENSLVILDEIGRGTGTYDGLAIAQAAIEFLSNTGAVVLFATHYFELTQLETNLAGVCNLHVAAQEEAQHGLRFYHQVLHGAASKSYGVHVAQLAGLPPSVTSRAEAVLRSLEGMANDGAGKVAANILALDLGRVTPLEALGLLEKWQKELRGH
ncbi:MAG: DNA mismatch repair protein MutS [Deinococcales bacterium]